MRLAAKYLEFVFLVSRGGRRKYIIANSWRPATTDGFFGFL
jgi:hypothetical protein